MTTASEPIEPSQVWTREEWLAEQPWGGMPQSDLRYKFKTEGFSHMYSGSYNIHGSATGRFKPNMPPMDFADIERRVRDGVHLHITVEPDD